LRNKLIQREIATTLERSVCPVASNPEPYIAGLPAKQIEFAREIVPSASTIGLLTNLKDPKAPPQAQELQALGPK
jgi:hypothetical protein